jgi:hypothetical protein
LEGVSTSIAAVATAPPSEFCTDEDNSVIRSAMDGCLEIFKKIITLLTVTVLFLFAFFNLIFDAPRISKRIEGEYRIGRFVLPVYQALSGLLITTVTVVMYTFTVSLPSHPLTPIPRFHKLTHREGHIWIIWRSF